MMEHLLHYYTPTLWNVMPKKFKYHRLENKLISAPDYVLYFITMMFFFCFLEDSGNSIYVFMLEADTVKELSSA